MTTSECLDEIQTPLNACSLEVRGSALVVGCYQLNEAPDTDADRTTEEGGERAKGDCKQENDESDDGDNNCKSAVLAATRSGELRLYSVPTSSPKFGEPTQVLPMESGVLDAKWCPSVAANIGYLAAACASGSIHVHKLSEGGGNHSHLEHVASSSIQSAEESHITPLALSLDWEKRRETGDSDSVTETSTSRKIVSSYSDGSLCLHRFHSDSTSLVEEERWDAHTLFGCPSEVWTCCFAASASTGGSALSNDGNNLVLSGGDDCILKLWDVRTDLSTPLAKVGNTEFDAGVTAVSHHPTVEHVAAVGSYDEVVRLYDVRNWKEPLCRVNVGGGVWRIRWHPKVEGRILVGAMHGGCRIVTVDGLGGSDVSETDAVLKTQIESEFTKHESMAYGADWLVTEGIVCCATDGDGESSPSMINEYAASCSFYDRRVCLWRSTNA